MYNHPQSNEEFLKQPSAVSEVLNFLDFMINANQMDDSPTKKSQPISCDTPELEIDDFLITVRPESMKFIRSKKLRNANVNQFTFMRQLDQTPKERSETRNERAQVAMSFRRLGNFFYSLGNYDQAINAYNYGLQYIKDTPVLYVNRALCYIKKRNYKRAIMDCDYVINNLSDKYVVAWLYRAGAYKRLNDEVNYNRSIYTARRINTKNNKEIDFFISKIATDL